MVLSGQHARFAELIGRTTAILHAQWSPSAPMSNPLSEGRTGISSPGSYAGGILGDGNTKGTMISQLEHVWGSSSSNEGANH